MPLAINPETVFIPSDAEKTLRIIGENIRLARTRRQLSEMQVAGRTGITRATLHRIENGEPGVAMIEYLRVLFLLGLEKDLFRVGAEHQLSVA